MVNGSSDALTQYVALCSRLTCYVFRSTILKDVATSSARNRPEVTKTLLVLGEWMQYARGRKYYTIFPS